MIIAVREYLSSLHDRIRQTLHVYLFETLGVANFLARLSSRERLSVGVAALAVGVTVVYTFVIDPIWALHTRLQTRIVTKEREVQEVAALGRTYEALRQEVEQLRPVQNSGLSPFAILEGLAKTTFGREKLVAINPAGRETTAGGEQETLELKLSGVSLQDIVALLYKMEAADSTLRCTNLAIQKRYKDPYTFDVALTAIALTR